jgi:glycogen synthase
VWGKTGSKLYGARSGADYVDNHKRFTLFCKAAIESVKVLPFGPGEDCVFVANDWHSGLVPLLIKDVYQPRGQFKNAKVAFCIHNIAFQGRFWPESFKDMALPPSAMAKLGFKDGYNKVRVCVGGGGEGAGCLWEQPGLKRQLAWRMSRALSAVSRRSMQAERQKSAREW